MATLHQEMSNNLSKVLLVDIELIKEAVRQVLDERGIYQTPPQPINKREWYDTTDAYPLIGLNTSAQLRKLTSDGTFRIGIEVRDRRLNDREKPRYQFHIERCKQRLETLPAKRTRKKKSAA
jgi:hypothetical protein